MITSLEMTTSKITFDVHNNETILTEQLSKKPLKIVNPKSRSLMWFVKKTPPQL